METHVVLRRFDGPDGTYEVGELVNASPWKNTQLLMSGGFLRIATAEDLKAAEPLEQPSKPKKIKKAVKSH